MPLREYVFRTSAAENLLCRWTKSQPGSWILIQLLRARAQEPARAAIFTLHGPPQEAQRFLKQDFGRRYGTFNLLHESDEVVSVEVTNYLLPTYRGQDPVELATRLLGPDALVAPILVKDGFLHVRVVATPPAKGRSFQDLLSRIGSATRPEEFRLVHTGPYDPVKRLVPTDDSLTDRQRETLDLALEFGFYDNPRRCTLSDIAKAAGVSKAAVHKLLVAAESKVIKNHSH